MKVYANIVQGLGLLMIVVSLFALQLIPAAIGLAIFLAGGVLWRVVHEEKEKVYVDNPNIPDF